jgi:hypothetical protein
MFNGENSSLNKGFVIHGLGIRTGPRTSYTYLYHCRGSSIYTGRRQYTYISNIYMYCCSSPVRYYYYIHHERVKPRPIENIILFCFPTLYPFPRRSSLPSRLVPSTSLRFYFFSPLVLCIFFSHFTHWHDVYTCIIYIYICM